ncbi:Daple [Actinoplanes sp. NPDC051851]|uniref:Daple n=1 Tax=Actinoplanes sp. NPDC051851 TaxID=3154753 RepID=UPI0034253C0E
MVSQRASVPMSRPGRPEEPIRSRHALVNDVLAQGLPQVSPAPVGDQRSVDNEPGPAAAKYDSPGFPRRGYEPPAPVSFPPSPLDGPPPPALSEPSGALPQRVPAQPDVPRVPEPPSVEPSAEAPALARIATHLRRGDVVPAQEREEGFDVQAILAAVREVAGVRDASLRATPAGAHSLRLDLSDGADPAEVSRQVARLLQDRMGLDAAPPMDAPPPPFVPGQATRAGRATVKPITPIAPASAPPIASASAPPVTPASAPPATAPVSAAPVSAAPLHPSAPLHSPGGPLLSPGGPLLAPGGPLHSPTPLYAPGPPHSTGPVPSTSPLPTRPAEAKPEPKAAPAPTILSPADLTKPRPLDPGDHPGPRVIIENVHVNTSGADATVEVRLRAGSRTASGTATGPAVDGYLLRLCATATGGAIDELLSTSRHEEGPARCFVEHAAAVSFGQSQVAVVVLLLSSSGGWVEQLAGSAVVTGDERHAMVRATLAAVNRRLEALLA